MELVRRSAMVDRLRGIGWFDRMDFRDRMKLCDYSVGRGYYNDGEFWLFGLEFGT